REAPPGQGHDAGGAIICSLAELAGGTSGAAAILPVVEPKVQLIHQRWPLSREAQPANASAARQIQGGQRERRVLCRKRQKSRRVMIPGPKRTARRSSGWRK